MRLLSGISNFFDVKIVDNVRNLTRSDSKVLKLQWLSFLIVHQDTVLRKINLFFNYLPAILVMQQFFPWRSLPNSYRFSNSLRKFYKFSIFINFKLYSTLNWVKLLRESQVHRWVVRCDIPLTGDLSQRFQTIKQQKQNLSCFIQQIIRAILISCGQFSHLGLDLSTSFAEKWTCSYN